MENLLGLSVDNLYFHQTNHTRINELTNHCPEQVKNQPAIMIDLYNGRLEKNIYIGSLKSQPTKWISNLHEFYKAIVFGTMFCLRKNENNSLQASCRFHSSYHSSDMSTLYFLVHLSLYLCILLLVSHWNLI